MKRETAFYTNYTEQKCIGKLKLDLATCQSFAFSALSDPLAYIFGNHAHKKISFGLNVRNPVHVDFTVFSALRQEKVSQNETFSWKLPKIHQ